MVIRKKSFAMLLALVAGLTAGCAREPLEEAPPEPAPGDTLPEAPPVPPAAAGGPARVTIVDPADGANIGGPDVTVRLSARGIRITPAAVHEPGTAHHHLFLDLDPTPTGEKIPAGRTGIIHLGKGDSAFTFLNVAPGPHRIIAVLGDSAHVPLAPLVSDTLEITVAEAP